MSYILEMIREKKKQKQNDLSNLEQEFERLNISRNTLIMELKDLEINSLNQEEQLIQLNQELDLLEDTLLDLVGYLMKSCDELSVLVSELRPSKNEKKKKNLKKKTRENSKIQEESLSSDIENIKKMINFLMNEYKKTIENKKKDIKEGV